MLTFSTRSQFVIGITLVLLLIGTRGHHFATLYDLPGASWAVFFLAGVYLRLRWALPGLLATDLGAGFRCIHLGRREWLLPHTSLCFSATRLWCALADGLLVCRPIPL